MGIDYSSVAGIGIGELCEHQIYEDMILKRPLTDEEEEEEIYYYGLLSEFVENCNYIEFVQRSDWANYYYYYFATDPINGVDNYIKEMNELGFNITRDDLEFTSEVDVC